MKCHIFSHPENLLQYVPIFVVSFTNAFKSRDWKYSKRWLEQTNKKRKRYSIHIQLESNFIYTHAVGTPSGNMWIIARPGNLG